MRCEKFYTAIRRSDYASIESDPRALVRIMEKDNRHKSERFGPRIFKLSPDEPDFPSEEEFMLEIEICDFHVLMNAPMDGMIDGLGYYYFSKDSFNGARVRRLSDEEVLAIARKYLSRWILPTEKNRIRHLIYMYPKSERLGRFGYWLNRAYEEWDRQTALARIFVREKVCPCQEGADFPIRETDWNEEQLAEIRRGLVALMPEDHYITNRLEAFGHDLLDETFKNCLCEVVIGPVEFARTKAESLGTALWEAGKADREAKRESSEHRMRKLKQKLGDSAWFQEWLQTCPPKATEEEARRSCLGVCVNFVDEWRLNIWREFCDRELRMWELGAYEFIISPSLFPRHSGRPV